MPRPPLFCRLRSAAALFRGPTSAQVFDTVSEALQKARRWTELRLFPGSLHEDLVITSPPEGLTVTSADPTRPAVIRQTPDSRCAPPPPPIRPRSGGTNDVGSRVFTSGGASIEPPKTGVRGGPRKGSMDRTITHLF